MAAATTVVEPVPLVWSRRRFRQRRKPRALRSSAQAAEWPRASYFSWGWAWCSPWLLWARGDDGPALLCHGAVASACKGRQGQQHMTLACM